MLFPSAYSWRTSAGVVLVETPGSLQQLRVLYKCTISDIQVGQGVSAETKRALWQWTECEIDVARFWPVVVALPPKLVWLMDDRNPNRQYGNLFECTISGHTSSSSWGGRVF